MHFTEAERVLGIVPPYTESDVKKAYRRRSRETHPDLGGKDGDFVLVTMAKELLDKRLKEQAWEQAQAQAPPPTSLRPPPTMYWTRPPPFQGGPTTAHSTRTGRRTGFGDRDEPWGQADAPRRAPVVGYRVVFVELLFDGRPYPDFARVRAEIGVGRRAGIVVVLEPMAPVRSVRRVDGVFYFEGDPAELVRFGGEVVDRVPDEDGLMKRFSVDAF